MDVFRAMRTAVKYVVKQTLQRSFTSGVNQHPKVKIINQVREKRTSEAPPIDGASGKMTKPGT